MRLRGMGLLLAVIWLWTAGCGSSHDQPWGLNCASDELCVTRATQLLSYHCVANPCGDQPLDCSCAASACGAEYFQCGKAEDNAVSCFCPTC
jgi:hypothetical protein